MFLAFSAVGFSWYGLFHRAGETIMALSMILMGLAMLSLGGRIISKREELGFTIELGISFVVLGSLVTVGQIAVLIF